MIQYRNKKWLLWDKAGTKILGRHPSKQAAEAQAELDRILVQKLHAKLDQLLLR